MDRGAWQATVHGVARIIHDQRIARRDKKTFLSDQCKEIEENNRMEKTDAGRDLEQEEKGTLTGTVASS